MRAVILILSTLFTLQGIAQLPEEFKDSLDEIVAQKDDEKTLSYCKDLENRFPGNPLILTKAAYAHIHLRQYDQCMQALQRIDSDSPDNTLNIQVEILTIEGSCLGYQGLSAAADSVFQIGAELITQQNIIAEANYDHYSSWAENSFFSGEPLTALEQMETAGNMLALIDASHESWARFHSNIGVVNWELGRLQAAAMHMNKSLEISQQYLEPDDLKINVLINNLGVLHYHSGDSEKAMEFYRLAHERWIEQFGIDYERLTLTHNNMARIYGEQRRYMEAFEHIERSLAIANSGAEPNVDQLTDAMELKGRYLREQGNPEQSIEVFDELLALHPDDLATVSSRVSDVWKSRGTSLVELGRLKEAEESFNNSLKILSEDRGGNKSKRAEALGKLSEVYLLRGDENEARKLALLGVESTLKADSAEIALSNIEPHRYSMLALENLGDVEREFKQYDQALTWYNLSIDLLDSLRIASSSFESRRHLAGLAPDLHGSRIACLDKCEISDQELFSMFEEGKAYSLNLVFDALKTRDLSGVDEALLAEEEAISSGRSYWKDRLLTADSSQAKLCHEKLFDLSAREDTLEMLMEKNAPGYFALRQRIPTFDLENLRSQLGSSVYVSYFTTDSTIYALAVSKSEHQLIAIPSDSIGPQSEKFKRSTSDIDWIIAHSEQADSDLISSGRALHKMLIDILPAFARKAKRLLISPHGELQGINFSLLLSRDVDKDNHDLASLPYLLTEKEIGYLWSTKQMGALKDSTDPRLGIWATQGENASIIAEAKSESDLISRLVHAVLFTDNSCSESTFKKSAANHAWLHLACHGHIASKYQEFFLELGATGDEDGNLTFGELSGMKLRAEHVTLSACKSGLGAHWAGETTTSIATGFALAGCPSVTMSLWNANDLTTSQLMQNYYEHLSDGECKTKAMQLAQLNFLKTNSDPLLAHPYYWGSFVVFGDPAPISSTYSHFNWITASILIIGLLWGAYVLRFYLRK